MSAAHGHHGVTQKLKVRGLASVAVIYWEDDPSQILIEMKDGTHPLIMVRHGLCIMGGNYAGPTAKNDRSPLDTLLREILGEELSFERKRDPTRLVSAGLAEGDVSHISKEAGEGLREGALDFERLSNASILPLHLHESPPVPSEEERKQLEQVKRQIRDGLRPFGAFHLKISRDAILAFDPTSTNTGISTVVSIYQVGLDEETWKIVADLHRKFLSMSGDALSVVTSLDRILEKGVRGAFGYEQILAKFWIDMGYERAAQIPFLDGPVFEPLGAIMASYDESLMYYEVENLK